MHTPFNTQSEKDSAKPALRAGVIAAPHTPRNQDRVTILTVHMKAAAGTKNPAFVGFCAARRHRRGIKKARPFGPGFS